MGWRKNTASAVADRKGATSLEYAICAAALAAPLIVAFNAFFIRVMALLTAISV